MFRSIYESDKRVFFLFSFTYMESIVINAKNKSWTWKIWMFYCVFINSIYTDVIAEEAIDSRICLFTSIYSFLLPIRLYYSFNLDQSIGTTNISYMNWTFNENFVFFYLLWMFCYDFFTKILAIQYNFCYFFFALPLILLKCFKPKTFASWIFSASFTLSFAIFFLLCSSNNKTTTKKKRKLQTDINILFISFSLSFRYR